LLAAADLEKLANLNLLLSHFLHLPSYSFIHFQNSCTRDILYHIYDIKLRNESNKCRIANVEKFIGYLCILLIDMQCRIDIYLSMFMRCRNNSRSWMCIPKLSGDSHMLQMFQADLLVLLSL
jgi:hypothetical protein